ncbi:MAG: hypothetical protein LBG80_09400 [Bacteroidales bacterium]|jgi:hypothetical protein|nr:hypothetical protein [Bacteroidales bacterium]
MPNIIIILEKYSDWLESYNVIKLNPTFDVHCHYITNDRNDPCSVTNIFNYITDGRVYYYPYETRTKLFDVFDENFYKNVKQGDILVAPFIRYRNLWKFISKCPRNVTTVHLSECLPDAFGHIGYRIGYRGKHLKSWLTLPLAKIYAMMHKPDICYYPLYPAVKNTFVKTTYPVNKPPLLPSKAQLLKNHTNGIKRPLLISGFGYNVEKMAKCLNIEQYIATSKNLEIIVDGKTIPLTERICAEEVLLSGYVSSITGYSSSAMVWAKFLYPDMPIQCYEAKGLDRAYGKYNSCYTKRVLKKIGIDLKEECKEMLD